MTMIASFAITSELRLLPRVVPILTFRTGMARPMDRGPSVLILPVKRSKMRLLSVRATSPETRWIGRSRARVKPVRPGFRVVARRER
jgi:hypothetical protein